MIKRLVGDGNAYDLDLRLARVAGSGNVASSWSSSGDAFLMVEDVGPVGSPPLD